MKHPIVVTGVGLVLALAQTSATAAPSASEMTALSERELVKEAVIGFEVAHDRTDGRRLRDLLASDAQIVENGRVLMTGGDKIAPMIVGDQHRLNPGLPDGQYGLLRHFMTNVEVTLEADDRASATAYCLVTGYDKAGKKPGIISVGQYAEELVKQDGQWKIRKLAMTIDQGNEEMAKSIGLGPHNPMFENK